MQAASAAEKAATTPTDDHGKERELVQSLHCITEHPVSWGKRHRHKLLILDQSWSNAVIQTSDPADQRIHHERAMVSSLMPTVHGFPLQPCALKIFFHRLYSSAVVHSNACISQDTHMTGTQTPCNVRLQPCQLESASFLFNINLVSMLNCKPLSICLLSLIELLGVHAPLSNTFKFKIKPTAVCCRHVNVHKHVAEMEAFPTQVLRS